MSFVSSSGEPSSLLLDQAHLAAQRMSLAWIRSVFREVCYQLWKDHWKVEHVDAADEATRTHCRLHLTADMVAQAQSTCQRVADRWSQRLAALGHVECSKWIQHVVQQEGPTLFFVEDEERGENGSKLIPQRPRHSRQTETHPPSSDESTNYGSNTPNDNNTEPEDGQDQPEDGQDHTKKITPKSCVMATLRQLELPKTTQNSKDDNDETTTEQGGATQSPQLPPTEQPPDQAKEQYVIDQLDAMGLAGTTYWPFEWEIIDQAARRIPARIHSTKTSELTSSFQMQLVPKSRVGAGGGGTSSGGDNNHDNDNNANNNANASDGEEDADADAAADPNDNNNRQDDSTDHPTMPPPPGGALSETEELMLISYKRKGFFSKKETHKRQKLPILQPDVDDVPRPPHRDDLILDILWNAQVSRETANPKLDSLLHTDAEDKNSVVPHTLLGALKTLGHIHHVRQMPEDYPGEGVLEELTDKQHKRKFQVSFRERLGPHQLERELKDHQVKTKVKRALNATPSIIVIGNKDTSTKTATETGEANDAAAAATTTTTDSTATSLSIAQRWWDLDLGECLLDLETGEEPGRDGVSRRRLYAFSTLEVSLLDEDEPPNSKGSGSSDDAAAANSEAKDEANDETNNNTNSSV